MQADLFWRRSPYWKIRDQWNLAGQITKLDERASIPPRARLSLLNKVATPILLVGHLYAAQDHNLPLELLYWIRYASGHSHLIRGIYQVLEFQADPYYLRLDVELVPHPYRDQVKEGPEIPF